MKFSKKLQLQKSNNRFMGKKIKEYVTKSMQDYLRNSTTKKQIFATGSEN